MDRNTTASARSTRPSTLTGARSRRGPASIPPTCSGRRGVLLFGDENDDELADLWSAVDRFESMVEARGGDTLTNSPDSAEPDNPAFVLPERRAHESAGDYTRRILEAAAG